jgi:hypothetical protein
MAGMTLDGRQVRRALSTRLRPELRDLGFDKFDVRHSWRRNTSCVDLITFRFISNYDSPIEGCPTLSFRCIVGVYYPITDDRPQEWATEYNQTFSAWLGKTIHQPYFRQHAVGNDRPNTWFVFEDGSNLDAVVDDAAQALLSQGIPFIERLDSPQRAIDHLRNAPETRANFGQLGIMSGGRLGSPRRTRSIEKLELLVQ